MTAMDQSLPEINKERINSMRADISEIKDEVGNIKAVLDGTNGEGLKTRVGKLGDRVDLLLKIAWATFGTIWAAIIVALLSLIIR